MRFSILNSNAERRDGLKALLRQIDRLARFTEAQDWRQIERTFKRHRPDLLVVDWQDWMTVADARELLSHFPDLRVAVLTDNMSPATVRALMDEGVLGVIPRETDPSLIIRALEMVLLGGHYVPPGALALDPPLPPDTAIRHIRREEPTAAPHQAFQRLVASSGADHALRSHGQHQQDDRAHARH